MNICLSDYDYNDSLLFAMQQLNEIRGLLRDLSMIVEFYFTITFLPPVVL
jgi:hypothetical protein